MLHLWLQEVVLVLDPVEAVLATALGLAPVARSSSIV